MAPEEDAIILSLGSKLSAEVISPMRPSAPTALPTATRLIKYEKNGRHSLSGLSQERTKLQLDERRTGGRFETASVSPSGPRQTSARLTEFKEIFTHASSHSFATGGLYGLVCGLWAI